MIIMVIMIFTITITIIWPNVRQIVNGPMFGKLSIDKLSTGARGLNFMFHNASL